MARDKRRAEIEKLLALYRGLGAPPGGPAEQTVWLVLARHGSGEGANRAFKGLWKRYVDVNELRVAKATEVAAIVGRHVRGDSIAVAEVARGFLRRFHKDQHTIEFAVTESMTLEQLRKYLANLPDSARELGLALFIHYCQRAQKADAEEAAAAAAPEGKPKKRADKDLVFLAERMRLTAAVAAKGEVVAKAREATTAKGLDAAWTPGSGPVLEPLPAPAPAEPAPIPTPGAPAGTGSVGGRRKGATRPRTTRTAKARQDKRSSRR